MPDEKPPRLRVTTVQGVATVGFVDTYLQSADVVQEVSDQLFELYDARRPAKLLLHFDGVRFLSSEMIGGIVKLHKMMARAKGRLRLCGLAPAQRDVFRVSGLDKFLEIFDDERQALAKF